MKKLQLGSLYILKGKIRVTENPEDIFWTFIKCNFLVLLEKTKYSELLSGVKYNMTRYKFISPTSGKVYYSRMQRSATYYFEKKFFEEVC